MPLKIAYVICRRMDQPAQINRLISQYHAEYNEADSRYTAFYPYEELNGVYDELARFIIDMGYDPNSDNIILSEEFWDDGEEAEDEDFAIQEEPLQKLAEAEVNQVKNNPIHVLEPMNFNDFFEMFKKGIN